MVSGLPELIFPLGRKYDAVFPAMQRCRVVCGTYARGWSVLRYHTARLNAPQMSDRPGLASRLVVVVAYQVEANPGRSLC